MIDKKQSKTLKGLQLSIFQKTNTQINMTLKNPHSGKDFQWSSVEHTDKHHGKNKARTHNNLFTYFKGVLEENGLWKDIEGKLGRKSNNQDEEVDIDNKYGFVYITTNLVNGMRYIGKHTKFGDDHLGNGTNFKKVVDEMGRENFEREIVAYAFSAEQLNALEKVYIDTFNAIEDDMFYNLAPGGDGCYEKEAQ